MVDFHEIYAWQAARYDQMVRFEDYRGNLLPALAGIRPFSGQDVVELGAGTGRLTRLIAPHARRVVALDVAPAMLAVARRSLGDAAHLLVGDARHVPLAAETADLALIGWVLGHFTGWHSADWQTHIGRVLAEMKRALRPGGVIVILETLGTGQTTPAPPHAGLAAYYRWLKRRHQFQATWLRTDYRFPSVAEAESFIRFFFGPELAAAVARRRSPIVPECTGIWWLTP